MIEAECHWITNRLRGVRNISIMDIGGGTHYHRLRAQPYIGYQLHKPLHLQDNRITVFERRLIQRKKDVVFSLPVELAGRVASLWAPLHRVFFSWLPAARMVFGDCERLPVNDESYDGIFMLSLLEHVRDPAGVIKGAARILKKGGFMFVSIPEAYQYHPAPIDPNLRMNPEELAQFVGPYLTVLDRASLSESPACRVSIVQCRKE